MGSEYDRKFEEMKKYIPFLESMIKRLESNTSLSSNPRQAQLDKIRSLRDLLLDKKKRMKMDNLLKCEQVLVNLYAKVEQKDTLPVVKVEKIDSSKDSAELEAVRNKLKTVVKMQNVTETLPEIARASEREEICEPGSKEPALFQRRPNRSSSSPPKRSPKKVHEKMLSPKAQSRRNYTRVLVSPERRPSRWPSIEDTSSEKQLFSRRSPIKPPRRNSPPYHKKERKKSSNSREGKSRKDLNITLKVPEESLHSLNTDDILSRIINCSDGDVDIDTLRELRSQILGELKQTGSNDDISELILKSYNKKSKPIKKKKELEVEEGEISDSESEAIENVYGSLLVMDKDKKPGQMKSAAEKNNQQRKIQICLVINSEKDGEDKPVKEIDLSESGVFKKSDDVLCIDSDTSPSPKKNDKPKDNKSQNEEVIDDTVTKTDKDISGKAITTEICEPNKSDAVVSTDGNKNNTVAPSDSPTKTKQSPNKSQVTHTQMLYSPSQCLKSPSVSPERLQHVDNSSETTKNMNDFFSACNSHTENLKALSESDRSKPDQSQKSDEVVNTTSIMSTNEQNSNEEKTEDSTEIPLLNEPTLPPKAKKDVLSEIDILQALKNEILSETIPIAPTEVDTPALHKPKLTKVASAMETGTSTLQPKSTKASKCPSDMPKKRISIENYKKKSETVVKSLFVKRRSNAEREEMKKQSLKLTDKECERFNFSRRISLDDDTDDISDDDLLEDEKILSMNDIYSDLAPKSPDQDNFSDDVIMHDDAPVLIPMEPVKSSVFTKADVDFRTLSTPPQPVPPPTGLTNMIALALSTENSKTTTVFEPNKVVVTDGNRNTLVDPRLRRELSQPAGKDSPNPYNKTTNIEGTLRINQFPIPPSLMGQNITPSYTPSYAPSMTPIRTPNARSYEMTPLRQTVEESQQKHVYAPSFSMCDNRENSLAKDVPIWEPNKSSNSNDDLRSKREARNSRWESSKTSSTQRDSQPNFKPRNDKFHIDRRDGYSPSTTSSYGWTDCPSTPGSSFGLLERPMTPSHPFGRSECPATPSHPFGRSECPATPSHPFGRSECPATPSHPFGRSECPATPSHPFVRTECPATPSHSFGRSECPPTSNHQFGRPDFKDPRLNRRQSDYESRTQYDDRDDGYQNDRSYNRSNSYKSHNKRLHGRSDSPRNYEREQHFGRNDRYQNEQGGRFSKNVSDLPQHFERARSFGRNDKKFSNESFESALPREDSNRLFTRNRDSHYDSRYSDHNEEYGSRRNQREKSIGKATLGEPIRARRQSVSKSEYDNKSLSVKRQADRSFTIDTSVNSTFQNLIESGKGIQVFDYTLDARRQRAASVGRSLVRESSVNRTMSQEANSKEIQLTDSSCFSRRSNFQRASSVGRVIVDNKNEKSFQEIKADFESYRSKNTTKDSTKDTEVASKSDDIDAKKATLDLNSRSRKDNFEKHGRSSKHIAKQPYSPKKNTRDPRMRMDHKDSRNNRNDRGSGNSWDRRNSGISYSNDNIAKGTIMGTGFGVKNYKIPKIKRPEPERSKTPVVEVVKEPEKNKSSTLKLETIKKVKSKDKSSDDEISDKMKAHLGKKLQEEKSEIKDKVLSDDGNNSKNKLIKNKDHKTSITSEVDCEKRVTRSSKKSDSSQKEEPVKNTKRIRKAIIDSDSDDELAVKTINENTKIKSLPNESEMHTKQNISEVKHSQGSLKTKSNSNKEPNGSKQHKLDVDSEKSAADRELRKTLEDNSLDSSSSFGMDDMDIFSSDNIVSDPVIDNINDLIADLDHDISATKSTNDRFTTETEKIMGAIDSQEENTLGDISELIEKDLNESNESLKQNLTQKHDKNLVNELELVTGAQNTTPIIATTMTQKNDTENSITSQKTTADIDQSSDSNVPVDKLLETKGTNSGVRASIDEMVSTTHIDQSNSDKYTRESTIANKTDANISNIDQSVPDSTIVHNDDVPEKLHESLPDSTMEIHSEVSSDVTSTLNDTEKSCKETAEPSPSSKEVSAIESFGSLLSILQDKTKIKQFLSMLGGQSGESEKLKKKLEKLSEIVSDEEDTNDEQSRDCDTNKSDKVSPEILSHEITDQCTDTQEAEINKESVNLNSDTQEAEINKESVNLNSGNENDESVKKSDTEKSNEVELCKDDKNDSQPENNKTESSKTPPMKESKFVNNEELKNVISQTSDEEIHDDPTNDDLNEDLESNENQDEDVRQGIGKTVVKKTKITRKGKGKGRRGKANPKTVTKSNEVKIPELKPKIQKKPKNRELFSLQNDIKEMFMCDEVLNATGIRMCRLAKMVDKKAENDSPPKDSEPLVLLQKYKSTEDSEEPVKKLRKKPGPKPKPKIINEPTKKSKSLDTEGKFDKPKNVTGYKPGPKSRTKQKHLARDPYEFETDSAADTTKESDANSSDSENESIVSTESFGSSEVLAETKKKIKKKRNVWQSGVIKPRYRKKKEQEPPNNPSEVSNRIPQQRSFIIPDLNCFTDKMYCFQRNVFEYDCRLCDYTGTEIVNHYKKEHAHTEVPLSRMDPDTAKKAIEECEEINFHLISKIPSQKYTCRFCYKEFNKHRVALENFFRHVVATHTGEFKHLCYECVNVTRCPFKLDIPPPPKNVKGQLIGYICGKCNYTQISIENLKTHVIVRHNDEQTEVYTINLGAMSQKVLKEMLKKCLRKEQKPRTLRSSRFNQSAIEVSDDRSEITDSDQLSEVSSAVPKEEPDPQVDATLTEIKRRIKPGPMKCKIRFETDDHDDTSVKLETDTEAEYLNETSHLDDTFNETTPLNETHNETSELDQTDTDTVHLSESFNEPSLDHAFNTTAESDNVDPIPKYGKNPKHIVNKLLEARGTIDVFKEPHFKLNYKETGAKEYVCCVNGAENHYRTTLLISLKKHVQNKHLENWDGYCCLCKVIVTLQGVQCSFKDCLTHFLDKHMDDFPIMEKVVENTKVDSISSIDASIVERTESPKTYIAVRPLSDLISKDVDPPVRKDIEAPYPVIDNVVGIGNRTVEVPQASPVYPTTCAEVEPQPIKPFQYEEVQAEVMSKKHRIVLPTMMPKELLVRVFKCAGHYCSFTSDSAEDSLVHASAHKQLGGEGAMECAYCNFDAAGNAIDLVMHVFKEHGRCHFSCELCFYRAAADSLVGAHFSKAHEATGKAVMVLRTTSVVNPAAADTTNMLPREVAVLHYVCNHGDGNCKFRTYTPVKFYEHMQEKHGSANSHPCDLCDVTVPTPAELVKHMKSHGLQLYQCTWCVHGANSEAEMLSHAASFHPTKNPQAYLRIIKNKDRSKDLRVLPLIYLKSKVPVEDVTPSKAKENPTREAERSIELEKLIKHSTLIQDNQSDNATDPIPEALEVTEAPAELTTEACDSTDEQSVQAIVNSLISPPEKSPMVVIEPSSSAVKDNSLNSLSINRKIENIVYCLDSDEEEAVVQNEIKSVINLSDDELEKPGQDTPVLRQLVSEPIQTKKEKPKFKKLSLDVLFKCPNCEQNSRNVGGFKRHTNSCCLEMTTIRCPHAPCPIVLTNITQLINHYNKDHNALNLTKLYYCGICKTRCSTLNVTKKHLKDAHGVFKVVISSKIEEDGTCIFTVAKETQPIERPSPLKRKASVETPKKFGIEDIDKLPINPIMDSLVYCNICEFSTKVRLNMVRHLQLHAERQPVPQTAPVNPVPHLETNEKHFDRMVNLASSSAATRADKPPAVTPEAVSRYPKYVPERQRHTCGAQGCSYISVDEGMLRCHWETLHSAAVDYHCAHCPPYQHLDTTKPLNASRIIAHLKMHDVHLYACSSCTYYHYKKQIVEKHIADTHKDKGGHVQTVRDEGTCNPVTQSPAAVGTMDLRPWQCGLCRFRSMLRRDLIEHCSKNHQTKMQYKCAYCPFRTSDVENIVKHQSNAHPTKPADVFYYYYREGDVADEADGTPRWQKQMQICGIQDTEVKTEPEQDASSKTLPIDLNLVKKEVAETSAVEMSIEKLCNVYGQFCDPNGISFKCSLCKTVMEYTREAMQSHLYEELKYRRWSCAICTYKAYHKTGLNDHMASEHNRNFVEPSELPVNINIEKWVSKLLDHQSAIIDKNKVNNQPKLATEKPVPGPAKDIENPKPVILSSDVELEQAFGSLGSPKDDSYCCPKCKTTVKDEDEMRNHLESELTKIRWCCTKCTDKFPTFHEAQFHCKSHPGPLSRPKEAIRDPSLRSSWVTAVINTQKKSMKPDSSHELESLDLTDTENSLLVVRYEEAAPTEEQLRQIAREDQLRESRKRVEESDSDEEDSMVIYEPENKKYNNRNCPYCDFVSRSNSQFKLCMREHILRHYNLKVLTCSYCDFNASRKAMYHHLLSDHPGQPHLWKQTPIPNMIPSEFNIKSKKGKNDRRIDDEKLKVCLHCEASVSEHNLITHIHGNKPPEFGERGAVVVKCCICLTLRINLPSMEEHYKATHPDITNLNYAYYKLQIDTREVQSCGICKRRFTFLRDLRIHHSAMHGGFNLSYNTVPYRADEDDHDTRGKRKLDDVNTPTAKRVAKKSTSKLPHSKLVARKSTTKLPLLYPDSDEEYSYYGTKPSSFNQYENVKTMMPMYNTMVEIDVKKLSGILKIDPKVVVKDFMLPFSDK